MTGHGEALLPIFGPADRPTQGQREERDERVLGEEPGAEAAADVGREHAHVLERQAEHLGEIEPDQVGPGVRDPDGQLVATRVVGGLDRTRLHRVRRVAAEREAFPQHVRRRGEGRIDVPGADEQTSRDVVPELGMENGSAVGERRFGVGQRGARVVVDLDGLEAVLRGIAIARDDHRDRLSEPEHLVHRQHGQRAGLDLQVDLLEEGRRDLAARTLDESADTAGQVGARERRLHPGDGERRGDVEPRDARVGEGASQDGRVQRSGDGDVGDEAAGAADEPRILLAPDPLPHEPRRGGRGHLSASRWSTAAYWTASTMFW
jgi:hypothetical protein